MEITNSEMEEEIKNFIKVWLKVLISLCYCYAIGKLPNKLIIRLMFITPIIFLFFYLPLSIPSINFGGTSAFLIAWLANFKLLLFAFGKGPLSPSPPLSLPHFLAVSCLPIKIKSHNNNKNDQNPTPKSKLYATQYIKIQYLNYPFKALLLGCLIKSYDYSHHYMNQKFVLVLYCIHIYLSLDLTLAISRAIKLLGLELEPLFNEPYLSNSLQDFWGRRWNLTVTNVLRPTVYDPTRMFLRRIFKNQEWARFGAVLATFLVSGIMHEVMFYYIGRVIPTGEVTCFFLLHGVCLGLEDWLRKRVGDTWRLPRVVSTVLTVGFVLVTALWLFMPQFTRNKLDERAFEEYAALGRLVKRLSRRFVGIFLR